MDSRFSSQSSSSAQEPSFHYSASGRQAATPSYPASYRLQPTSIPPSQTLPPLSSHDSAYTYPNDPSSHRNQNTQPLYPSGGSGGLSHSGPFPVYPPTATTQLHPHAYQTSSTRSQQSPTNYSPSWSPQTSAPHAYQSYNPATASQGLPSLLPLPNNPLSQQNPLFQNSSPASVGVSHNQHLEYRPASQQQQQQQSQSQQSQPTHVVGSQGRRGILPCSTGRPAAIVNGSSVHQKPASTPAKDAEGKFPCEHCNKNYLHAKHLKRHLLRHTGVRPYSCGLCEDTFARSDILKRHFQKCSVRRGNPSGASHLTHSKNSKKSKGTPVEQLTIPLNPMNNPGPGSSAPSTRNIQQASYRASPTPTLQSPLDLQGMSNLGLSTAQYQEDLQSFSNRASRANSTKRSSTGMTASSRTTSGPSSIAGPDSAFSYSNGQVTPDSLTTSGAATPYSIHHESRLPFSPDGSYHAANGSSLDLNSMSRPHSGPSYPSGHHPHIIGSANGSRHDLDALFSSNAPDDFNQHYPTHHHEETHHNIKSEPDYADVHYTMTGSYPMT